MDNKKKPSLPSLSFMGKSKLKKNREVSSFVLGMNIVINFGIIMAVSLFITINVGLYLDKLFHSGYLFVFLGLLLGIFSSFRVLFDQLKWLDTEEDEIDE